MNLIELMLLAVGVVSVEPLHVTTSSQQTSQNTNLIVLRLYLLTLTICCQLDGLCRLDKRLSRLNKLGQNDVCTQ